VAKGISDHEVKELSGWQTGTLEEEYLFDEDFTRKMPKFKLKNKK
jgi:hypothetical protein